MLNHAQTTTAAREPIAEHPRITVIGVGYLGATHAVCMAELGFDVMGVDVDEHKIEELRSGRVPIFEPGLQEKLVEVLESGRLSFTTDFDAAAQFGDVHFVCVGTPQAAGSYAAGSAPTPTPSPCPTAMP